MVSDTVERLRNHAQTMAEGSIHYLPMATDLLNTANEIERLRLAVALQQEALNAIKVRVSFIGHPKEPRDDDGKPSWANECRLIEFAQRVVHKD